MCNAAELVTELFTRFRTNRSHPSNALKGFINSKSSSRWDMYFALAAFMPKVLSVIFWGLYSDKFGRKALLWVPWVFTIYYSLILIAWNLFDLPVSVLSLASLSLANGLYCFTDCLILVNKCYLTVSSSDFTSGGLTTHKSQ